MDRIAELRAELRAVMGSMEYAYAMGHSRTMGARDPRLDHVIERVEDLERRIVALKRADAEAA